MKSCALFSQSKLHSCGNMCSFYEEIFRATLDCFFLNDKSMIKSQSDYYVYDCNLFMRFVDDKSDEQFNIEIPIDDNIFGIKRISIDFFGSGISINDDVINFATKTLSDLILKIECNTYDVMRQYITQKKTSLDELLAELSRVAYDYFNSKNGILLGRYTLTFFSQDSTGGWSGYHFFDENTFKVIFDRYKRMLTKKHTPLELLFFLFFNKFSYLKSITKCAVDKKQPVKAAWRDVEYRNVNPDFYIGAKTFHDSESYVINVLHADEERGFVVSIGVRGELSEEMSESLDDLIFRTKSVFLNFNLDIDRQAPLKGIFERPGFKFDESFFSSVKWRCLERNS